MCVLAAAIVACPLAHQRSKWLPWPCRCRNELAFANDVFGAAPATRPSLYTQVGCSLCGEQHPFLHRSSAPCLLASSRAGAASLGVSWCEAEAANSAWWKCGRGPPPPLQVIWDPEAKRPALKMSYVHSWRAKPLQVRLVSSTCLLLGPAQSVPPSDAGARRKLLGGWRSSCAIRPFARLNHASNPLPTPLQELLLSYGDTYWPVEGPKLRRKHEAYAARAAQV